MELMLEDTAFQRSHPLLFVSQVPHLKSQTAVYFQVLWYPIRIVFV